MDLQHYDRIKTALAEILRGAKVTTGPSNPMDLARKQLFARLAEDRFNLVVVGRFSRGKTSLMNAMLGTDRLPTGIVPVTSVITTVTYGTDEKVVLYYNHTSLFFEIPISELAQHVTERGNPGNSRDIRTAEVHLPADLLRRGFYFIDTPGLGSSIVENTRTTEAFLPHADAFILVTSYDSPLSEEEQRVLQTVGRSGRRVFIVVNKQDRASPQERQEVLDHLNARLSDIFGANLPQVFSVSAQQALQARLHGDEALLATSALPAFEAALLRFLMNEKLREFLLSMCSRIAAFLRAHPETQDEQARLEALRAEIESVQPTQIATDATQSPISAIPPTIAPCQICAAMDEALFDFLAKLQYQLYGDHRAQAELAERRGLCGPHTWQFEGIAAPNEVCTAFASVTEGQASYLRSAARSQPMGALACQAIEAAMPNVDTCSACAVARGAADRAAEALSQRLILDQAAELRKLSAICLPHLRLLVLKIPYPAVVQALLLREANLLDRITEDMRRFALKRDGMMRQITTKEEVAAGQRALRVLVGHPRAQLGPEAPRAAVKAD